MFRIGEVGGGKKMRLLRGQMMKRCLLALGLEDHF